MNEQDLVFINDYKLLTINGYSTHEYEITGGYKIKRLIVYENEINFTFVLRG